MAKTEQYTAAQMIEALQNTLGIKSQAAHNLGCSRATVDNYIAKYPTVKAAWKSERGRFVDLAQSRLAKKVQDGDDWAIAFTLKTLGKDEGFTERTEVAGVPGLPVGVKHELADGAVADLLSILAGLGALQPGAEKGGDAQTQ